MQTETDFTIERPSRESRRSLTQEGGLPELLDALRWRWKPTLLIAVLFILGATLYVESLPSQHHGKAVLSIAPRNPSLSSEAVRVVGPKYPAYVTAPATIALVAPRIHETTKTIEKAIDSNLATDTGNMKVVCRLENQSQAAACANAFAKQPVTFSKKDPILMASLVAPSAKPATPAAPPRRLLELASLFIGVLLGVVASLLLERGRPRLRSWRDLARASGYPVVGRIPPSRALRHGPAGGFSDL